MNNLHIVTVATDSDYYFPYLVESCKRNGKELTVLGYSEKWEGFTWKFKLMIDYLENLKQTDIVCFVDGYDVICARNLNELIDEFIKIKNETNCKIIVGYDKINKNNIFYYISKLYGLIQYSTCKGIPLNSGTYIGYVSDVLYILKKTYMLNPNYSADDQTLLTKYCNSSNDIYIDVDNTIFLALVSPYYDIDELVISENCVVYNNKKPFFLHGPGQTYLDNTIRLLGYNLNNNDIKKKMQKKLINRNIFYIKNNLVIIFIVLFIFFNIIKFYKKSKYN